ncbi:MAG TPA: molybdopterin-dependent oxidoreductase [Thermoanaerobaculia bacterium]|nr:molybdopterin-dependent oxidoreductase [Thermoanaerobaculia bacterium]
MSPSPSRIARTTCPMDCPDTCAVEVEIAAREDGRPDRVVALHGAAAHPTTDGFLCSKVARFGRRLDHADRLLTPLRRTGGKGEGRFEPISWEVAIAEIAGRLRQVADEWGGEAILPFHYGGSNGLLADDSLDDLLFARLGASRLAKTICAAPATAVARAMVGRMPGVAHEDYVHARAIVLWGANPKVSSIHLVPFLREARRRGALLAVVDPELHFSRDEIDLHLPVRPGTDLPLALAIAGRWSATGRIDRGFLDRWATGADTLLARAAEWDLERAAAETGVAAGDIARLADLWADAEPAVLRIGWGLERNKNGGQAMAAVLALPALAGKLGVRGGGYTLSNRAWTKTDLTGVLGDLAWNTRSVNMTRLGAWLAPVTADRATAPDGDPSFPPRPPVKALFVYNANPLATVPDQAAVLAGLARPDLYTVVFEQVMTDTARWADVVLPATTFLEQWEIKPSYGSYGVGGIRPAVAPRGEARANWDVFAELGRALGFTDEAFGWDSATAFEKLAAASTAGGEALSAPALAAGGWQRPPVEHLPVPLVDVFPATPDGKIRLAPPELGSDPYRHLPPGEGGGPLTLISPADGRRINSSLGELAGRPLAVTLSPADAAARRIVAGDRVRVWNELGEVICPARVSARLRPGVVKMPKGAWRRDTENGATAVALCPATVGFAGGACFNDARVEVERLAPQAPGPPAQ